MASTESTKPHILFIHGSWHSPVYFESVRNLAQVKGIETSCPLLPSTGALPPTGLKDDANAIGALLAQLVEAENKDVIVVAHSYGGMVASEGVDGKYAKAARVKEGKKGGVIRVVYMCAFIVEEGKSLCQLISGQNEFPPFIPVDDKGMCTMNNPEHMFYNDLPVEEQKRWAEKLIPCPGVAQQTPLTKANFVHHPTTYLFCENDNAIPIAMQEKMAQAVEERKDIKLDRERLPASHSPFLSMPDKLLEIVSKYA